MRVRIKRSRKVQVRRAEYWSLHTHSRYSFNDALPSVKDVVAKAKSLGYRGLGLTDHGNMAGAVQLYQECMKAGIKPFPGSEFYVVMDREDKKAKRYHVGIVAYTEQGYRNLVYLSSLSHANFHHRPLLDLNDLAKAAGEGRTAGLAITTGCHFGLVIQTLIKDGYDAAKRITASLAQWFEACYVEIQNHEIERQHDTDLTDAEVSDLLVQIADELGLHVVITQDSHYCEPDDRAMHETLKQMVSFGDDVDDAVFPGDGYHMVGDQWMKEHHPAHYERGVAGLNDLLERHTLRIPELDDYEYRMPALSADPENELFRRVYDEMHRRGLDKPRYWNRLESEMEVIKHTRAAGYLLLVAKVTDFCQENEIFFQARGSASGSMVCWLLGITPVDPIKWGLLMERFLSKDRTKPPDIDLDVEYDRRREVLEMLNQSFSTMQIGTWGTYSLNEQGRGSLLVKAMSRRRKMGQDPDPKSMTDQEWADLRTLDGLGLVSGYGVHAAGVLLTSTKAEMEALVPTMYVASSKTTVSQYDMGDVEKLGVVKLDVLGLKTLSVLRRTVLNLKRNPGDGLDFIPLTNSQTYTAISNGQTAGVFQLEGGSATRGIRTLRPTKIGDVIAAMALYRPATMSSGATESYERRKRKEEEVPERHEIIHKTTASTYGILLYQEQVMALLRELGMEPEELTAFLSAVKVSNSHVADARVEIRRLLDEQVWPLCERAGMNDADYKWLEEALIAYADYGFNMSHAVVYGLTSYRTAYLATHHPVEFFAALLSVFAGDKDKEPEYIRAARARNVRIMRSDINISGRSYSVDHDRGAIRKGFLAIKGVGEKASDNIVANQPFTDFQDFVDRVDARLVSGVKKFRHKKQVMPTTFAELEAEEPVGVLGKLVEVEAVASLFEERK